MKFSNVPMFAFIAAAVASPAVALLNNPPGNPGAGSNPGTAPVTKMEPYSVVEAPSAKTHTLFMGADFSIVLDKDSYPVRDVSGANWVIVINGKPRQVSAKQATQTIKVAPSLKLTETSAFIQGFTKMPGYSFDNDPNVLLTRGMSQSAQAFADIQGEAQDAMNIVDTMINKSTGGAAILAGSDNQMTAAGWQAGVSHGGTAYGDPLDLGGKLLTQNPALQNAAIRAAGDRNQTGNGDWAPSGKLVSKGLDALDVDFDIRCSKLLRDPYVITTARFHAPNAKPGMVQNLIYAESIHPIDDHLSHVHFVENGFPYNYELLDFHVHLYDNGEEIATNISEDRVELTRDEAFQYVRMEYIAAHHGETLPPVPAMAKLPGDFKVRITEGLYRNPVYVRVDQQGVAFQAFSDPACTKPIDDGYLNDVVRRIRFKPALNDGKPVAGTLQLNLSQLKI